MLKTISKEIKETTLSLSLSKSKVVSLSWGRPEGSLFNSYNTEVQGRAQLLPLDCSTLLLIRTLYGWLFSNEVSSTILKVFGMTWPRIEPRSPGPLTNTLPTRWMKVKVKLATVVEGDPKEPFSIVTIPKCRGGLYSIPLIARLYPWSSPYCAKC